MLARYQIRATATIGRMRPGRGRVVSRDSLRYELYMDLIPLIFAAAGAWNLFLASKNLRLGHAAMYFQRFGRDEHPRAFWMLNLLLVTAGIMLILGAVWAAHL